MLRDRAVLWVLAAEYKAELKPEKTVESLDFHRFVCVWYLNVWYLHFSFYVHVCMDYTNLVVLIKY